MKIIALSPPLLTDSHIKEKIICIRGHRERMFNTSFEYKEGKHLFHNYGQGGAGWTFLFGCVQESMRQFENDFSIRPKGLGFDAAEGLTHHRPSTRLPIILSECNESKEANGKRGKFEFSDAPTLHKKPITIIGAGCYGLLTAILLKRAGHEVTIVAKETNAIPSYKAAGFFFPRPRKVSNAHETQIFLERGMESYATYLDITKGTHPFIKAGPQLLPAYYGADIDPGFGPYIKEGLMPEAQNVIIDFGNGKKYEAREYHALFINACIMMQELQRNIHELNIPLIQKEIRSFDEIDDPIIFNCTNLGAKALAHDPKMIPIQGHLISLTNQPEASQLQYMINFRVTITNPNGSKRDELIYFAPKDEGILGITFLRGQDSLTSNQHEFDRLLQRSRDFFSLRDALRTPQDEKD